jgi:hypothetical protein
MICGTTSLLRQSRGDFGQDRIADADLHEVLVGGAHVIRVGARQAYSLAHEAHHVGFGQAAGVLRVAAVGYEGQGGHAAAVVETDAHEALHVNARYLLALAQVGDGGLGVLQRDAEGDAAAAPAPVEAEHETWRLRGTAMHMREDAQGAVIAVEVGAVALDVAEAGPPHERAVSEHPQIVFLLGHAFSRVAGGPG